MASHGLSVDIADVWRRYGTVAAVAGVSLDVNAGEFVSLLGPSGSGKTTLLMMLAGFDDPDSGAILVGGADITPVPPNKRDIAMVFQRYALFPHMTVEENIAFPLRMRGMQKSEQRERVARALDMVKLTGFGGRRPAQLSGGQQQRVALARAIVFEPPVILMDEPLGALDKKLRQHMQIELKQLQQRLGATVIYVTHDQEEALTMSDRVAVMDQGRLVQYGLPRDLYARPANAFVAEFIGEMNFLSGRAAAREGGLTRIDSAAGPMAGIAAEQLVAGQAVRLAVRPEHVRIDRDEREGLAGALTHTVFNGANLAMLIALSDGSSIRADVPSSSALAALTPGASLFVSWSPESAHVFRDAAA